ncbi:ribosome maturation factor RimP [Saccharopolyspora gloriosae]|uniref:Ribosome maturation factor RimP n=1 Tax=Saccharopolyspora gloriosae TaxID=455344 RepID=A0A840NHB4_9PSEU|nr:ribosome maturation factor RimP [Saccharopolyspora gloriosae]
MSSPPRDEAIALLEPVVADAVSAAGFDLEELDVQQAGRRRLVKVVVDSDDGVGLDEISELSRAVSKVLDAHEHVLAGAYTLEVTSPGTDRPLTRPRHWRRAQHRLVKIKLSDGGELTARVGAAADESVQVLVEQQIRTLAYRDIERAVVEVEFQQPPAQDLVLLKRAADGPEGDDREDTEESR